MLLETEEAWKKMTVPFMCEINGSISIYRKCPICGKLIKAGKVFTNINGNVKLEGWICKTHGEVEPYYEWT
jgi:hypothetical protein